MKGSEGKPEEASGDSGSERKRKEVKGSGRKRSEVVNIIATFLEDLCFKYFLGTQTD